MPLNRREIIKAVSLLAQEKKVVVSLEKSVKAGCIAGSATIAGGLLLGPAGLAIGGVIGGCTAALVHRKMKSVPKVIKQDMTSEQQEQLAEAVSKVIKELNIDDVAMLVPSLLAPFEKAAIIAAVVQFLKSELNLRIVK